MVVQSAGKDWDGDSFDSLLVCNHQEEVDEYIEHLYCCDYKKVSIRKTKTQEIVVIDTPYDEEVNRTRNLMYNYFMDRVYDIDGQYICDSLGITPETLKGQLEYLLGEVDYD